MDAKCPGRRHSAGTRPRFIAPALGAHIPTWPWVYLPELARAAAARDTTRRQAARSSPGRIRACLDGLTGKPFQAADLNIDGKASLKILSISCPMSALSSSSEGTFGVSCVSDFDFSAVISRSTPALGWSSSFRTPDHHLQIRLRFAARHQSYRCPHLLLRQVARLPQAGPARGGVPPT